ncbi:MAG: DUF1993 domain-containing protein [Rhodobacteraceae bacterium]|nr:DUF1993 domain-containing protein [Paracoccaceae bacterium]
MHAQSAAVFDRFLGSLSAILDKAEAHCDARKIDPAALLTFRLYPDMFPLMRQVQLATDFAKGAVARLARLPIPSYADVETTFAELQERIARTRAFIASVPPEAFDGAEARDVTYRVRGQDQQLNGQFYLSCVALPNFFFHLTTAYNILRHNGVELGKADFVGG